MWMTIRSSSCLWKRTWVKNSRVPWSPKAAKLSASPASGPEQVSTSSASTATGLDAAVAEAEVRLVVHAVQALDDRFLHLVDDLGPFAGLGVDLVDALVVHLHLEVGGPAPVAAQPGPRVDGTLHPPQ